MMPLMFHKTVLSRAARRGIHLSPNPLINDSNRFTYLIFELEVTTRPLLGDEQQVVEEEEVPLLALQTLE